MFLTRCQIFPLYFPGYLFTKLQTYLLSVSSFTYGGLLYFNTNRNEISFCILYFVSPKTDSLTYFDFTVYSHSFTDVTISITSHVVCWKTLSQTGTVNCNGTRDESLGRLDEDLQTVCLFEYVYVFLCTYSKSNIETLYYRFYLLTLQLFPYKFIWYVPRTNWIRHLFFLLHRDVCDWMFLQVAYNSHFSDNFLTYLSYLVKDVKKISYFFITKYPSIRPYLCLVYQLSSNQTLHLSPQNTLKHIKKERFVSTQYPPKRNTQKVIERFYRVTVLYHVNIPVNTIDQLDNIRIKRNP